MAEKEYFMLREEIIYSAKSVDTLSAFLYTCVVALLGIAIQTNSIAFYLLPFIVIVPITFKIFALKDSIIYIAAYMHVALEGKVGIYWETNHIKYSDKNKNTFAEKLIYYGTSFEFILLSSTCTILFWWQYLSHIGTYKITSNIVLGIIIAIQVMVNGVVLYLTILYMHFNLRKPAKISNWRKTIYF